MKKSTFTLLCSLFFLSIYAQDAAFKEKLDGYLQQQAAPWQLEESDVIDYIISDQYTTNDGHTYIYVNQAIDGIPIHNRITPIIFSKEGKVFNSGHRFIAGARDLLVSTRPTIAEEEAILRAAEHMGILEAEIPTRLRSNATEGVVFASVDFAHNQIGVKKAYYYDGEHIRLSFTLAIDDTRNPDYILSLVDVANGQILDTHNYTTSCMVHGENYSKHDCNHEPTTTDKTPLAKAKSEVSNKAGASYGVFPFPAESPIHGPYEEVIDGHFPAASPFGWHDIDQVEGPEFTITRGNNVHAYKDLINDDTPKGDEPDGGEDLQFNFGYSPDDEPFDNDKLSVTNLFYINNMIHDITYVLGFDEKAGNFQQNNYGNGGNGEDYVLAQAFDGFDLDMPNLNNANFSTPPDGFNGRMQMYLWQKPSGSIYIEEPADLKGFITRFGTAQFGGSIPFESQEAIEGNIVLVEDQSIQNKTDGCQMVLNGDAVNGNIALIDRGNCDFVEKVFNAQNAGAIAAIVCNVVGADGDGEEIITMAGENNNITIPAVFFPKSTCDGIKASLSSDIDVHISLKDRGVELPRYLDGSLDNGIIAHEYGHGISNRLSGGPGTSSCMNSSEQSGEGISDFFSILFTVEEGDTRYDSRGIGTYADNYPAEGKGIRRYKFSSDMSVSPLTYDDMLSIDESINGYIYSVGEIWTNMLWELYWNFVDRYGLDTSWENEESGNFRAGKLVIGGLAMQPCNATFVEARDAILKADSLFYDAENSDIIWEAFAKRGLGYGATAGENSSLKDGTSSYVVNPLIIQTLKIQKSMPALVEKDQEITATLHIVNHDPETKDSVVVVDEIPAGLEYIPGSASIDATVSEDGLTFFLDDMLYKQEITITYGLKVLDEVKSETLFYEDLEDINQSDWKKDFLAGFDRWRLSNQDPRSGENCWQVENTEVENDQILITPPIDVVGERPVLRLWHRFETETGTDGGFIQISTDNELTWQGVDDYFIRNGYNSPIAYSTFAIPSLTGYSGSTDKEFIDTYLDLSAFKGTTVNLRFRFGSNETIGIDDPISGWSLDDFEILDLKTGSTIACVQSGADDLNKICTEPIEIIYNSVSTPSSTSDPLEAERLMVYPNPTHEFITLEIEDTYRGYGKVEVISVDGQVIMTSDINLIGGSQVRSYDVSHLAPGLYIMKLSTDRGTKTSKFIKN